MLNAILISSASSKLPLFFSVRSSLERHNLEYKIIVGDSNPLSLSSYFADDFWQMPSIEEITVSDFIEGCLERKIKLILPTRDGELEFYAKNYSLFEENGIQILISKLSSVRACLDKISFSQTLESTGFPVVPSFEKLPQGIKGGLAVKERFGAGSRSMFLNITAEEAELHALTLNSPIYQPFTHGQEISIDVWLSQDGSTGVASPRSRDLIIDGEAKVTSTFSNSDIEKISLDVCRELEITGICVLQGFITEDNNFVILECNTRFGGATTASINSGVPLLDLLLLDALQMDFNSVLKSIKRKNIVQVRAVHDYCF